jgi:hypothetical protein
MTLMQSSKIQCTTEHFKCDVYSFGIILYEIINGVKAWSDEGGFDMSHIRLQRRPKIIDRFKRVKAENIEMIITELSELVKQCWMQDPKDRPDFHKLVSKLMVHDVQRMNEKGKYENDIICSPSVNSASLTTTFASSVSKSN